MSDSLSDYVGNLFVRDQLSFVIAVIHHRQLYHKSRKPTEVSIDLKPFYHLTPRYVT